MKRMILLAILVLGLFSWCSRAAALEWMTDITAAQAKAKAENKFVLLDFTGSDWCGWCIKLRNEVFEKPEFAAYAGAKLILVEVDFPRKIQQTAVLKAANQGLSQKYRIEGYPTIIVLDPSGKKIGQTGYLPGGPSAFLASLDRMPGLKQMKVPIGETPAPLAATAAAKQAIPAGVAPGPNADGLVLKAISGPKDHRLALINNEPISAGEKLRIKVGDQKVEVLCTEINDNFAVVRVEGRTLELILGGKSVDKR